MPRPLLYPPKYPIHSGYSDLTDLRLWLSFDERSGNKLYDRSKYKNHATLTNGTWSVVGRYPSVNFGGTSYAVITHNASLTFTNKIAVLIWLTIPAGQILDNDAIGKYYIDDPWTGFGMLHTEQGTDVQRFGIWVGGNDWVLIYKDIRNTGARLFGAQTDGVTTKVYLDGELGASAVETPNMGNTKDLWIGSQQDGDFKWAGGILDIKIFGHALSDNEHKRFYEEGIRAL